MLPYYPGYSLAPLVSGYPFVTNNSPSHSTRDSMFSLLINAFTAIFVALFTGISLRLHSTPRPSTLPALLERLFAREIAHRGGSLDGPENTMWTFRKAVERGVKAIEIDIQLTADNVPIGRDQI